MQEGSFSMENPNDPDTRWLVDVPLHVAVHLCDKGGFGTMNSSAEYENIKLLASDRTNISRDILQASKLDVNDWAIEQLALAIAYLTCYWQHLYLTQAQCRLTYRQWENEIEGLQKAATELLSYFPVPRYSGDGGSVLQYLLRRDFGVDTGKTAATMHQILYAVKQIKISNGSGPSTKRRGEEPSTALFLHLRRLYMRLGGSSKIGSGGPLYCFVSACVEVIGGVASMPEPEAFRLLLVKALKRASAGRS